MNTRSLIVTVCLAGLPACSHDALPPNAPAPPASAPPVAQAKSPGRGKVQVAEDILRACGISEKEAHFDFDSSNLQSGDQPTLKKVATCFTTGPLAGHSMHLVGHSDPRGDSEYNLVLGGSRADSVKSFLLADGMPRERVASSSRGELDANGFDERTWAEDRRVDVTLAH